MGLLLNFSLLKELPEETDLSDKFLIQSVWSDYFNTGCVKHVNNTDIHDVMCDQYWRLILFRSIFSIGQAGFVAIHSPYIHDLMGNSEKDKSDALTLTQIVLPVGGGVGFMVSQKIADNFGFRSTIAGLTPVTVI